MYRIITAQFDDAYPDAVTRFYGIGDEAGVHHHPTSNGTIVHSRAEAHRLRSELVRQWREEWDAEEVPSYRIVPV